MIWDEKEMDKTMMKYAALAGLVLLLVVVFLVTFSLMMPAPVKTIPAASLSTQQSEPEGNLILDLISPIVVLKGSKQYEKMYPTPTPTSSVVVTEITPELTVTPLPTVTVLPRSIVHSVNPFDGGERWERMWFRWSWSNVSGLQSADRGIVVYRHLYLDQYTYWNDAWGQYFDVYPDPGYRFLAVYVHQEDFSPDSSGIWGYPNSSFWLQYNGVLHQQCSFEPVYRISDLEDHYKDYYNIDAAIPYGARRVFGGISDAKTGGYHVEWWYSLWSGKGNAWDGYLLYQVPSYITDKDIRIVGIFAGKSVNWRFDSDVPISEYPIENIGTLPMTPVPISG